MKLFRVSVVNLSAEIRFLESGYVVAEGPAQAYRALRDYLDANNIGEVNDREMDTIELLADTAEVPACGRRLYMQESEQ